jgi:hypothetical protein
MREFYIFFSTLGWSWTLVAGIALALILRASDNHKRDPN